jgi:TolB protein
MIALRCLAKRLMKAPDHSYLAGFSPVILSQPCARNKGGTMGFRFWAGSIVALGLTACDEGGEDVKPSERFAELAAAAKPSLASTIAFVSTRDDPAGNPLLTAEIYLMDADGSKPRALTDNAAGDAFPALSPDGKKIVFDSNRLRGPAEAINTSDLFVMKSDGSNQTWLTRGSSGSWSAKRRDIVYHASASGTGVPIRVDPGSATTDSDIFVLNLDDLLELGETPVNITNDPAAVDDDPDWSPVSDQIVFTSHGVSDNHQNSITAEVYVISADGSNRKRLTNNAEEERAPAWSPDGSRILFMCRRGGPDFEMCVMDADGTNQVQLTNNAVPDLGPTWSPDGQKILFHRPVVGGFELFIMDADGTGLVQFTNTPGLNGFPNWGELRVND